MRVGGILTRSEGGMDLGGVGIFLFPDIDAVLGWKGFRRGVIVKGR